MKRLSEKPADRAVRLINQLSHTKGPFAGQSFDLRPWQRQIVKKLFTVRKDGLRKYRTCLLMLPRKNGKSELAAALAIYFLLFDGEIGAEVYSAAADKVLGKTCSGTLLFQMNPAVAKMIFGARALPKHCEVMQ